MARAALLLAVLALAPAFREGCAKALGAGRSAPSNSGEPTPPALPVTSATAPPIWTAPEAPPPPVAPAPTVSPELAKARAFAQAGDHKKVRALLEKSVKAGKGSRDEAMLLLDSCIALRDKACIEVVKTKYPEADGP